MTDNTYRGRAWSASAMDHVINHCQGGKSHYYAPASRMWFAGKSHYYAPASRMWFAMSVSEVGSARTICAWRCQPEVGAARIICVWRVSQGSGPPAPPASGRDHLRALISREGTAQAEQRKAARRKRLRGCHCQDLLGFCQVHFWE